MSERFLGSIPRLATSLRPSLRSRTTAWHARCVICEARGEGCHAGVAAKAARRRTFITRKNMRGMLFMDYYYVYILVSEKDADRHYTGCTTNLSARLTKHNRGSVPHTSKHLPWRIETVVRFSDQQKAATFERYLKSGSGREFARRHF